MNDQRLGYDCDDLWDYIELNYENIIVSSNLAHAYAECKDCIRRADALDDSKVLKLVKTFSLIELFGRKNGIIESLETSRGTIKAKKVGFAVAGHTSVLWQMAGLGNLPIESHKLQAFVTESIKPLLDHVVVYGVGGAHFYISQSDKGSMVFGGDLDWYKSYAQRGNLPIVQDSAEAAMAIMPCLGRIRLLRHWAGVMDMSMDGSFFICKTPLSNLYLNAGWNYGGFKASPASGWYFADLIANEQPHRNVQNHNLERFEKGINIDERGAGPDPKLHG